VYIPRVTFIAQREVRIATKSSSNHVDDHESLSADQEEAPKAQASTHDATSSSAMP
jgi:hypothetical protein